jgi:hypothetical protein
MSLLAFSGCEQPWDDTPPDPRTEFHCMDCREPSWYGPGPIPCIGCGFECECKKDANLGFKDLLR